MAEEQLGRARDAYVRGRWDEAYAAFEAVRATGELPVPDLAAMADAAWWLGHNDRSLGLSEEVHRSLLEAGEIAPAARAAVEIGFLWFLRGEPTVGSGWVSRASRLLADLPESAAHGYLLYLDVEDAKARGEHDRAIARARRMQELGTRHDDVTLATLGLALEGIVQVRAGRVADGMGVLDEAMLAVHAGQVTRDWAGNLYCQLMALFVDLGDIPRARAWTEATERWCDGFSNAAMFLGICRVHRAQLFNLAGDWSAAERCATQASQDLADMNVAVVAEAEYQLGELRRLRNDRDGADRAYARAHELGRDPQPGRALLRLAQGRTEPARGSLDAALAATTDPLQRAPLLAARVEVALVEGAEDRATEAARELTDTAETYATPGLVAAARQAAGTARLLAGEPERALPLLREACRLWRELDARHRTACTRARLAEALADVGDGETADQERRLASSAFAELGATHDLERLTGRRPGPDDELPGGLSAREAEVLVLVASGRSNRQVATELTLSERTVERHLSNIFVKLDVSSRTEAAAFAFAHGLGDHVPG